jgi:opacity protein-like surface antigen
MQKRGFLVAIIVAVCAFSVCTAAQAQTELALSGYGAFTGTTTSNGVSQSPSNAAGGLFEFQHISNPVLGFEGTYSFNRANQTYTQNGSVCGLTCGNFSPTTVSADAHEVTVDWTPSVKIANFRPFGVLGVGVLLNVPVGSQSNTQTSTKGLYVYGAGLDWGLLPHLGLRFQYRGNLYKAPDLSKLYTSSNAFAHTSEPVIGVYFRL